MRTKAMKNRVWVAGFTALMLASLSLHAADPVTRFNAKPGNLKVRLEGTSTIHDWQMEGPIISGFLEAGPGFPTEPGQDVKPGKVPAKVEARIPVRSLKSLEKDGKPFSDKMNEVAWEHLKMEKMPMIIYQSDDLVLKEAPKSKDAPYVFDTTGNLEVAGVTNKVSMPVYVTPLGDKTLKITGTIKLKMSDFKVEPPSPVGFGIKTGDEVKLFFEWTVKAPSATAAK
jgi:hypothetical protein